MPGVGQVQGAQAREAQVLFEEGEESRQEVSSPASAAGGGGRRSGKPSDPDVTGMGVASRRPRSWSRSTRRVAGVAGLAYVAGVGIENMEILEAPTFGSSAADIRASYEDQAFTAITATAGALALVAYCIFAIALIHHLRGSERTREPWVLLALVGGLGGPAVATVGTVANYLLLGDGGLSSEDTRSLFDVYLSTRMVGGVFVAMFLLGVGIAARRSGLLPRSLAWSGIAIAVPIAFAPIAAITEEHALEVAVSVVFGLDTLWIFLVSLWLVLADAIPATTFLRRAAFLVLVIAAGLVGIGLLAAPGATGQFFAWDLEPEPLAAFAGGVYVGAAGVYATVLAKPWIEVRGFVVGAIVLSVSVLTITLTHLDIFDFDRLQAWAWVVLFASFSLVTIGLLVGGGAEDGSVVDARPPPWARAVLACVALLLGGLAVALWVDPTGLVGPSPFGLPPLGGRFAGSWIALVAVLAGWGALENGREQARLAALAVLCLSAGALVAAVRTLSDLEPAGATAAYIAALALLVVCGAAVLAASRAAKDREDVEGVTARKNALLAD
jgi:hypothetical protein